MDYISLFLIAVSLAMDAFAVSVCNGITMQSVKLRHACAYGAMFGGLQFLMPVIGYLLGSTFSIYIESIDHWIAFALLAVIGGKMIADTFRKEKADTSDADDADAAAISLGKLFALGIATSIDALAVGISIALTGWDIWISSLVIGAVAFVLSFIGVLAGKKLGAHFQKNAGRLGGIILIGIGLKIVLEHLGVIA